MVYKYMVIKCIIDNAADCSPFAVQLFTDEWHLSQVPLPQANFQKYLDVWAQLCTDEFCNHILRRGHGFTALTLTLAFGAEISVSLRQLLWLESSSFTPPSKTRSHVSPAAKFRPMRARSTSPNRWAPNYRPPSQLTWQTFTCIH